MALSNHVRKTHSDLFAAGKDKYECLKCSITLTSRTDWRKHLTKMCKGHLMKSECPHCGNVYKTKQSLAAHMWRSHGKGKEKYIGTAVEEGGKTYGCSECSKVFTCENKWVLHKKMVHTVEDAPCDQCDRKFRNRWYLNTHKWNTHGKGKDRPRVEKTEFGVFQCDQCPNVYYEKRSLRLHRHNKHSGKVQNRKPDKIVPESERTCPLCQKVLQSRKSMLQHQRYVHSESKEFKCSVCSMSFNCQVKLSAHTAQHTGELDCPICEKTFKWRHSLTEHMRAHEGVRAYKCSFCPDDFIDNRALKKHTIKVHGQETKGGISKDTDLTKAGSAKMGPFFRQTEAN